MDVYKGAAVVERRRFSDLKPILEDFKKQGLKEIKSPRFKVLLKHPDRDEWAAVVKVHDEFILVHGGLDVMFAPPKKEISCRGCTRPWCGNCPMFRESLAGAGHGVRPGK